MESRTPVAPSPKVCRCCGADSSCECAQANYWHMGEDRRLECEVHRVKRWVREELNVRG